MKNDNLAIYLYDNELIERLEKIYTYSIGVFNRCNQMVNSKKTINNGYDPNILKDYIIYLDSFIEEYKNKKSILKEDLTPIVDLSKNTKFTDSFCKIVEISKVYLKKMKNYYSVVGLSRTIILEIIYCIEFYTKEYDEKYNEDKFLKLSVAKKLINYQKYYNDFTNDTNRTKKSDKTTKFSKNNITFIQVMNAAKEYKKYLLEQKIIQAKLAQLKKIAKATSGGKK